MCAHATASLVELIRFKRLYPRMMLFGAEKPTPRSSHVCSTTYVHPDGRSGTLYLLRTSHRTAKALISKQDTFVLLEPSHPLSLHT